MAAKSIKPIQKSKSDSEITVKKKTSQGFSNYPDSSTGLDEVEHRSLAVELPLAKFYDVEIKIGEKILRAHRAHLIQQSTYFEKIFEPNRLPFVSLELDAALGISAPTFELILEWMYSGKISLRLSNLDHILKAAERLGMKGLILRCNQFLVRLCETRGPMTVNEQATVGGYEGIKYYAMQYASRNFLSLTKTAQFIQYSKSQVVRLLSDDRLATPTEKLVFDAAVAWLKAKWRTRRECVGEIMACIRFQAMSLEELTECYRPQDSFIVIHPSVIGPFFKAFLYRKAQHEGYQNVCEHLGQMSFKSRSFPVESSELQNFTSRRMYQAMMEVGKAHTGDSEVPLRRTKSSIW